MMIRFHSFLFSLKAFSLMDTLYCFLGSFLRCFLFIFSNARTEVFAINHDLHPNGLVMIGAFIPDNVIADIHVSVLLRQFLKIGFVIMIIIALINQIKELFQMPQDKTGSDFIIIIQIDGTDNSFKGISKNRNPCTPAGESSSPFPRRMYFPT